MMGKALESRIGEMSIMDASGHKELKWKMGDPKEIAAAQETFDRLLEKGYSAFGSEQKAETKHVVKEFDPTLEELVMVPRTVGG
ncbi:hypothetical protein [Herbaspirillum sp. ST 5-3]|jgi:hypothetical protein|uniref:hypothetical protein n=2 Tax=Burkholderiales TaxID=80840 RepID=UPI0010A4940E|nr:hypothetical protein [Herbaspirillum sp. ST 5-3]